MSLLAGMVNIYPGRSAKNYDWWYLYFMGIKKTIAEFENKSPSDLALIISQTRAFQLLDEIHIKSKEQTVLASLLILFSKMAIIDREWNPKEIEEIKIHLKKFIKLDEFFLERLLKGIYQEIISPKGRDPESFVACVCYLSLLGSMSTKNRIYRYLCHITAADKKLENEEKYLLEVIGKKFGFSEKEIREYLLMIDLHMTLEELDKKDPYKDSYSDNQENPVIKFEIN